MRFGVCLKVRFGKTIVWSKNKPAMTRAEREHVERVKELPCSVCDAAGPSEAHHIKQSSHWTVIALCDSCHRNELLGWHGQKRMWQIKKMDEIGALSITVMRLINAGY